MLLMGDEVRRTQRGNNNAYCQDNELSYFNWDDVQKHADLLRFLRGLIRFNLGHRLFEEERFWTASGGPEVIWHGVQLGAPDFRTESHSLAIELRYPRYGEHLHIILNAYWEPLTFALPPLSGGQRFYRIVDTGLGPPLDYCDPEHAPPALGASYTAQSRSTVILSAR